MLYKSKYLLLKKQLGGEVIDELPNDIIKMLFTYLDNRTASQLSQVNNQLHMDSFSLVIKKFSAIQAYPAETKQLIKKLYFDTITPLGTSLQGLTSLETLIFEEIFNTSLGTSLQGLTSLKTLTFGNYFNKPLGASLEGLTSLRTVEIPIRYTNTLEQNRRYRIIRR